MGPDAKADPAPRVLLATAVGSWEIDEDAQPLTSALGAAGITCAPATWGDHGVQWGAADLVVVRSTWDYAPRREEYLRWARAVERSTTLANPADVIEWNTDKSYLGELAEAGVPVVPTQFIPPAEPHLLARDLARAATHGEFVVKPTVSAGSRDTGRFTQHDLDRALHLAEDISAGGRTVMLQPYLPSVDTEGETGLVYFEGAFSHAFSKAPMLEPGADPEPGLYAPERITASTADPRQLRLAEDLLALVRERFGATPLYARVDMVGDDNGDPVLMELELTEPSWFLATDPGSPGRAAAAIANRLDR